MGVALAGTRTGAVVRNHDDLAAAGDVDSVRGDGCAGRVDVAASAFVISVAWNIVGTLEDVGAGAGRALRRIGGQRLALGTAPAEPRPT